MHLRKNISEIKFPIFGITDSYKRIWIEDNITYIETASGVSVLDNKNLEGDTLGQRRLRIKSQSKYIPRLSVHTVAQLINSKYRLFIDNEGIIFHYVKHKVVPLKYYKVKKRIKIEDGQYIVLTLDKILHSIKVPARQAYGINYVGILDTDVGYIEYEYSEEPKTDTWRKI